jgi:acyl carrier protein
MEKLIKSIIENKFGISPKDYTDESNFKEDLGCDSLDVIDLVMEVEREFNISIPDSDIEKILTVEGLINYVKGRLN